MFFFCLILFGVHKHIWYECLLIELKTMSCSCQAQCSETDENVGF